MDPSWLLGTEKEGTARQKENGAGGTEWGRAAGWCLQLVARLLWRRWRHHGELEATARHPRGQGSGSCGAPGLEGQAGVGILVLLCTNPPGWLPASLMTTLPWSCLQPCCCVLHPLLPCLLHAVSAGVCSEQHELLLGELSRQKATRWLLQTSFFSGSSGSGQVWSFLPRQDFGFVPEAGTGPGRDEGVGTH